MFKFHQKETVVRVSALEVSCLFTSALTYLVFAKVDIKEHKNYDSALSNLSKAVKKLDSLRSLILPTTDEYKED